MTQERQYGSLNDGKFLLSEATRPSQVPYRCLLPEDLDNLLVPVCLSATHVGWGTLRLEPVWMHLGEVAPTPLCWPGAPALHAGPAQRLQRHLVERQVMITFYNDLDMATPSRGCRPCSSWAPGVLPNLRRPSARAPGRRHRRPLVAARSRPAPGPTPPRRLQAVYAALTGPG